MGNVIDATRRFVLRRHRRAGQSNPMTRRVDSTRDRELRQAAAIDRLREARRQGNHRELLAAVDELLAIR